MLDNLVKALALIADMKAAVPFRIGLTPELIAHLAAQDEPVYANPIETVTDVSYFGDDGGILCRLVLADREKVVFSSLTHLRVDRRLPFAAAAISYQKHRVKKFKKQTGYEISGLSR